jgi:hypothetical protein
VFVKNFGLFWRRDEVEWNPGTGNRGVFRLLGRRGMKLPGLRLADFRYQQGIYVLYGNHGPYYVGLTKQQGLGQRLKDHHWDHHRKEWDRFSWFGFCSVRKGKDDYGLRKLGDMPRLATGNPKTVITDVEALLIRAMGLSNINQMNFTSAEKWDQVKEHEVERYMAKMV